MSTVSATRDPGWLSWSEAAAIVGCPVPTIDWWARQGRIEKRPHRGPRPTLKRSSVEEFAAWYQQRERERAGRAGPELVRIPPEPTGWLTSRQTGDVLGVSHHHVRWLVQQGRLPGEVRGGQLWVRETDARAMAEERAKWVSYAAAAEIACCSENTILRAVRAGRIDKREGRRALPALERTSVERFAAELAAERLEAERRRAERRSRRPQPPDDGDVWFDLTTTALVIGLSRQRVAQLADAGRLPYSGSAGRRWFRRGHVEQVAAARALERSRWRDPRQIGP